MCNRAVPCPNDCSGHGDCVNGKCVCDFDYSGVDCGNGGHLKVEILDHVAKTTAQIMDFVMGANACVT